MATGLKILAGSDVPVYTLEHLTSNQKHQQGTFEKIVVPIIELGRDPDCVVAFGDDCPTVSRRHASITRNGKEVKVRNLSSTNPTLVNGRPVKSEYFLNSGDEIQLSMEGPRMRFNTSATGTARMGFTNKMNLVIQQAVKPYKTVVTSIAAVFILSIGVLGYLAFRTGEELKIQKVLSQVQADSLASLNQKNMELKKVMEQNDNDFRQKLVQQARALVNTKKQSEEELERIKQEMQHKIDSVVASSPAGANFARFIDDVQEYVLAIYIEGYRVSFGNEVLLEESLEEPACMCTGFLLNSGEFVTARHCIDLFMEDLQINFISNSGGKLTVDFVAESYNGDIKFGFTNQDMIADYSGDYREEQEIEGVDGTIRIPEYFNGSDWAYAQTSYTEGLAYDEELSSKLLTSTELHILGYPDGEKFRTDGDMRPDYNKGMVRRTGLTDNVIRGIQGAERHGNSGGPVFVIANGQPTVIGIVTGARMDDEAPDLQIPVYQVYTPLYNIR